MKTTNIFLAVTMTLGLVALASTSAEALTDCTFTTSGTTMELDADCTTDETIVVPDGFTLDGKGHAITAVDPPAGHFLGGVIENFGATAHVRSLVVHGNLTVNACDGGADRLRGIFYDGASGSIIGNTVQNINQGPSGCQEGNAIEVRNAPFDGTHPATETVEVAHNVVEDWQKTGIVCNGDVDCWIHHNVVGQSFTQANLAPNSVQVGFGAFGQVEHNHIAGNEWLGTSNFVGTAVLVFDADTTTIQRNNIGGNAQVGIFVVSDNTAVDNNRVFERDADGRIAYFDIGLWDFGTGNNFTNNKVRGYDDPAVGDEIFGTKIVPSPGDAGAACFLPDSSAQSC